MCNSKQEKIKDTYKMYDYFLLKQCINVRYSIITYKKYKICQLIYDRSIVIFSCFVFIKNTYKEYRYVYYLIFK